MGCVSRRRKEMKRVVNNGDGGVFFTVREDLIVQKITKSWGKVLVGNFLGRWVAMN